MTYKGQWRWQDRVGVEAAASAAWQVIGDADTQGIQARISLEKFGNETRKARLGKPRTELGYFGEESTLAAIQSSEKVRERSAKRKELTLTNVLGLGRMPRPR